MSIFHKITSYFVNSFEEIKKVSWPTKNEVVNLSIIVLISIVIAMLALAGIDWVLTKVIGLAIGG